MFKSGKISCLWVLGLFNRGSQVKVEKYVWNVFYPKPNFNFSSVFVMNSKKIQFGFFVIPLCFWIRTLQHNVMFFFIQLLKYWNISNLINESNRIKEAFFRKNQNWKKGLVLTTSRLLSMHSWNNQFLHFEQWEIFIFFLKNRINIS